jgi:hypothetical protein
MMQEPRWNSTSRGGIGGGMALVAPGRALRSLQRHTC